MSSTHQTTLADGKVLEYELTTLPLNDIEVKSDRLRDKVDFENEQTKELMESIRTKGIQTTLSVNRTSEGYELIDGLHRFSIAAVLGFSEVPVMIFDNLTENEILILQLHNNIQRVITRPIDIRNQLIRLIEHDINLTQTDLANIIGKSQGYVSQILQLRNLTPKAESLVNEGKIVAINAYQLARLPQEEQEHWLERAATSETKDFITHINQRLVALKSDKNKPRNAKNIFAPVLRSKSAILDAHASMHEKFEKIDKAVIKEVSTGGVDYQLGYFDALKWVLSQDDATIKQREEEMERQEQKKQAKLQDKMLRQQAKETETKTLRQLVGIKG